MFDMFWRYFRNPARLWARKNVTFSRTAWFTSSISYTQGTLKCWYARVAQWNDFKPHIRVEHILGLCSIFGPFWPDLALAATQRSKKLRESEPESFERSTNDRTPVSETVKLRLEDAPGLNLPCFAQILHCVYWRFRQADGMFCSAKSVWRYRQTNWMLVSISWRPQEHWQYHALDYILNFSTQRAS